MTLGDTEERRRYLNARSTIDKLLEWRAVPVINENDTVATSEIRYGDNDRLAARVATMVSADLVGAPFRRRWSVRRAAGHHGVGATRLRASSASRRPSRRWPVQPSSELSRGGMQTKIEAAKIATGAGTHLIIASGRIEHPLRAIAEGARCTWFLAAANPVTARKKWIAGSLEPKGTLDYRRRRGGCATAGQEPAAGRRRPGRRRLRPRRCGDDPRPRRRGDRPRPCAYDAEDAQKIKGRSSAEIASILGFSGRAEMIHRDDLVVGRE